MSDDLSVTVGGARTSLVAPNGAGKSTLHTLSGGGLDSALNSHGGARR